MLLILLEHGANINALSRRFYACEYESGDTLGAPWWTPLHTAICQGHESLAALLVVKGASLQVAARALGSSDKYVSALHISSQVGNIRLSKFIIKRYRCSIDIEDHNGMTPVAWAYEAHQMGMVEWLVKGGANVNAKLVSDRSLLLDACAQGRLAHALLLLDLGAGPLCSFDDINPLHYCCDKDIAMKTDGEAAIEPYEINNLMPLAKRLVEAGVDVNAERGPYGETPLAIAAARCSFLLVEYLLESGAKAETRDQNYRTPLMHTFTLYNHKSEYWLPTAKYLLEHGASANTVDIWGETPLEMLCGCRPEHPDKFALIKLLIDHGSPINATRNPERSFIYSMFMQEELEIADFFHRFGTRHPSRTEIASMVTEAIRADDPEAFRFILRFQSAPKIIGHKTRLFRALELNKHGIADLIFDVGAPWTYATKTGWSCLLHACRGGNFGVIQRLLQAGADPNCANREGDTPLYFAARLANTDVLETLLQYGADPFYPIAMKGTGPFNGFQELVNKRRLALIISVLSRWLFARASREAQGQALYVICDRVPDSLPILNNLMRWGVGPNIPISFPKKGCMSALSLVANKGCQEAVDLLQLYDAVW
ncbi:ankyrin repeat-containing domain protein [Hypoxylon trugodes]|uniref:ankyrin repeat-containing domain protein n=1 Tax=Hypoxylon trugodes TaxID=326681 RepID=UPI00218D030F|nr:ankyrin repeat-containing domain protein [Hypoxylon trugodes]KAI1386221.1 ankyrin repeat-containing domain protein [Hypoxylon trugodes]